MNQQKEIQFNENIWIKSVGIDVDHNLIYEINQKNTNNLSEQFFFRTH